MHPPKKDKTGELSDDAMWQTLNLAVYKSEHAVSSVGSEYGLRCQAHIYRAKGEKNIETRISRVDRALKVISSKKQDTWE